MYKLFMCVLVYGFFFFFFFFACLFVCLLFFVCFVCWGGGGVLRIRFDSAQFIEEPTENSSVVQVKRSLWIVVLPGKWVNVRNVLTNTQTDPDHKAHITVSRAPMSFAVLLLALFQFHLRLEIK